MTPNLLPYFTQNQLSPTLAINEKSIALLAAGRKVYRFGFGQSPFPVPDLLVRALQANADQKDYLPVQGLPALREVVAAYYRGQRLACHSDRVLIGPGSKQLQYLLQVVLNCQVLLPAPSWVSYAPQAKMLHKQLAWLPTCRQRNWMLAPESLSAYCQANPATPKLLILNYPSNPTGASFEEAGLQALAEVARQHKVIVLSDEIYGELYFDHPHQSIAHFYPEGTIISNGLSKWCGAGGWRLGYFIFPTNFQALLKAMKVAASETFSAVCAPVQYAAIEAFQGHEEMNDYLDRCRKVLKAVAKAVSSQLEQSNISHPLAGGGFYMLPDFEHYRKQLAARGVVSSEQLCAQLLEQTGVALLPGTAFGMPADQLLARLSYVDFDGQQALGISPESLEAEGLSQIAGHMLEGIEKMGSWLKG